MGADLVVRNARIVLPETGVITSGLVIKDGRCSSSALIDGEYVHVLPSVASHAGVFDKLQ